MRNKENLPIIIMFSLIPCMLIILSVIYLINTKYVVSLSFFELSIVFSVIPIMFIIWEYRYQKRMIKVKENNQNIIANIDEISNEDNILTIKASVSINKEYIFITNYKYKQADLANEIRNRMNSLNIKRIRVYVNLKKYEEFEFDVKELLSLLDLKNDLETVSYTASRRKIKRSNKK